MARTVDLTGQTFGKLTVVRRLPNKEYVYYNGKRASFPRWECSCTCGKLIETFGQSLRRKRTKSCGCLKLEHKHGPGTSTFSRLYSSYKGSATRRGLSFDLTRDEFAVLITSPCAYTGRLPQQRFAHKHHEPILYNGIDRKDSRLGYTLDNCVPCCFEVNHAKSDTPHDKFMALILEIAQHTQKETS